MNVVQVNTVCGIGSTGRIALDLYHLAEQHSMTSYYAYGREPSANDIRKFRIGNKFDFYTHVLSNFVRGNSGFASKHVTRKFLAWLDDIHPDLLHLHNLHGFYLNIELLFDYIKKHNIPVVWTLHDCWGFTGQCAYFDYAGCSNWKTQCHSCPIFRSNYPYSLFHDNSIENYRRKKQAFCGVQNMTIVTPSTWLANLVSDSFLKDYPIRVIPNGIDLSKFNYKETTNDSANRLILGVANVWTARKGLHDFYHLAEILPQNYRIMLVGVNKAQQHHIAKHYAGRISCVPKTNSIQELTACYQKADVFVNPTYEDNFPTTNLEALGCGTPVITYQTGGSPESITTNTGITVPKGDVQQLANAILSMETNQDISRATCREHAYAYEKEHCLSHYIHLYKEML